MVDKISPSSLPDPDIVSDQPSNLKADDGAYFTPAEIKAFNAAVERRVGRRAWEDWCIIMRVYVRASNRALDESGQRSRQNPVYKKRFAEILAGLAPISDSPATREQYRAALLNIADEGEAFDTWFASKSPRQSNPISLWRLYRRDTKDRKGSASRDQEEPTYTRYARELAQFQEDATSKIGELINKIARLKHVDGVMEVIADWSDDKKRELIARIEQSMQQSNDDYGSPQSGALH
jgi:hypothetical protein